MRIELRGLKSAAAEELRGHAERLAEVLLQATRTRRCEESDVIAAGEVALEHPRPSGDHP